MFSIRRSIETLSTLHTTCAVLLVVSLSPYLLAVWFRSAVAANPEKYVFSAASSPIVRVLVSMLAVLSAAVVLGCLRQSRFAWRALPVLVIPHLALVTWIFVSEIARESGLGFSHVLGPHLGEVAMLLAGTHAFFISAVALTKPSIA